MWQSRRLASTAHKLEMDRDRESRSSQPALVSILDMGFLCIASFCERFPEVPDWNTSGTHVSDFVRPRVVRAGNHERVERDVADDPALPPHPAGPQLQAVGLQGPVVPHVADPVDGAMSSYQYDIAHVLAYSWSS